MKPCIPHACHAGRRRLEQTNAAPIVGREQRAKGRRARWRQGRIGHLFGRHRLGEQRPVRLRGQKLGQQTRQPVGLFVRPVRTNEGARRRLRLRLLIPKSNQEMVHRAIGLHHPGPLHVPAVLWLAKRQVVARLSPWLMGQRADFSGKSQHAHGAGPARHAQHMVGLQDRVKHRIGLQPAGIDHGQMNAPGHRQGLRQLLQIGAHCTVHKSSLRQFGQQIGFELGLRSLLGRQLPHQAQRISLCIWGLAQQPITQPLARQRGCGGLKRRR